MIHHTQLRECVIRPALQKVHLWSEAAEELLMGTCAQESKGGYYLVQEEKTGVYLKGGLGIYQMEAHTHDNLWSHAINKNQNLQNALMIGCNFTVQPDSYELVWNLHYATIMTRIFYKEIEAPLPTADDIVGLANYWKKYYNTSYGAGTPEEFIKNYYDFIGKGKNGK